MTERTRIKFCGLTRAADLEQAVALGVDAIGLVCVPKSRRALSIEAAAALRQRAPAFVTCVVLLLDAEPEWVARVVHEVRPDLLQFHGRESGAYCRRFGVPYLKAIAVGTDGRLGADPGDYADAAALMLDSHTPGALGGTGAAFDWQHVRVAAGRRWVLAGGLTPDNVARAIAGLHPYAVDVSSGIESAPGLKDSGKMAAFVAAVQRADATSSH
ncbi:MAG TPA: phosphoribosylanthranilate isomerase [Nevskiaceae bacterium]|nr:phosphoribosylanthranilate isomerase [Nevskiaceae bacterium]